jgi:hypothetical protein
MHHTSAHHTIAMTIMMNEECDAGHDENMHASRIALSQSIRIEQIGGKYRSLTCCASQHQLLTSAAPQSQKHLHFARLHEVQCFRRFVSKSHIAPPYTMPRAHYLLFAAARFDPESITNWVKSAAVGQ